MTEPDALFEPPSVDPLRQPELLLEGVGKVVYSKYTLRNPSHCDDCIVVAYEANRAGVYAPPARGARHVRRQGSSKLYLCAEHAQLRRQREDDITVAEERKRHLGA